MFSIDNKICFILGVPRSGTTLFRVMLAGHPQLFSPPEMILAPFETMEQRTQQMKVRFWEKGGLIRAFMDLKGITADEAKKEEAGFAHSPILEVYRYLQELIGDRILVDKCPHLTALPDALMRINTWFPNAHYLWIVRNPGSIIRSIENMPMAEVMLKGYAETPKDIWFSGNKIVKDFLSRISDRRKFLLRYEDLVTNPKKVMTEVCQILDIPFSENLLDPYEGDRMREGSPSARAVGDPNMATRGKIDVSLVDSWLTGFDHRTVSIEVKTLAKEFGYDLDTIPLPPITKVTDELSALFETARTIEASISVPQELDALEGRRFLLRMLNASIQFFTEYNNVDYPVFHRAEGPTQKMFADCPDGDYWRAAIRLSKGRVYRLTGFIPRETTYLGIMLYRRGGKIGNCIHDTELLLDDKSNFELLISDKPQQRGNVLQGAGDEVAVMVRQYFVDRKEQRPVELSIEFCGQKEYKPILDAGLFSHNIHMARRMLKVVFKRTIEAYKIASTTALKRFISLDPGKFFPTPDNEYCLCWYRIGYNQIMFIRGRMPKARYVSITLYNAWMESFDYEKQQVHFNHTQIQLKDDGNFEVCLANRPVKHPNCLVTAGHLSGYIIIRILLPEAAIPTFKTKTLYETEVEHLF